MKRFILFGLLAAAMGAGAQENGSGSVDDRWYAGLTGGVARGGTERLTESTTPFVGIYFGRFFSDDVSLDLQIDGYQPDFDADEFAQAGLSPSPEFSDDWELRGYGLVGRYHFGETGDRHRFYGLAGVGIQEHDNFLDEGRDIYFSWGLGLRSELAGNMSLRTQLEGRYDNDRATFDRDHGFIDMIASIGLTLTFGQPRRPEAAPAEPRRSPEPPPRPAPPPAPEPEPEPAPEPQVLFDFDATVLFAFDSATLRPEAQADLDRAADVLAPRDDIVLIEVAGHTDSIGTEAYNQDLSERRAQAVADYLAERGVDRDRMEVVGYGESRPRVPNDSPENRQKNRRVTISTIED
jgi:OOP family OmpA-OmpF porin